MTEEASCCEKGVGGCGLSWSPNLAELPRPLREGGKLYAPSHPSLQVPWVWPRSWPHPPVPSCSGTPVGRGAAEHPQHQLLTSGGLGLGPPLSLLLNGPRELQGV